MNHIPKSLERVITELSKFPGIGIKTAQRLGLHVLKSSSDDIYSLANALKDVKDNIINCEICHNISEQSPCNLCEDPNRDKTILCIVENTTDILLIENTGYNGQYHVLGGVISPLEGIGSEHLYFKDLEEKAVKFKEVIIATNTNIEGDTTGLFISKVLSKKNIKITRLSRGLPVGGHLEYVDEATLSRALSDRVHFDD